MRRFHLAVLGCGIMVAGCGGQDSIPANSPGVSNSVAGQQPPAGVPVARMHWIGTERLQANTNASRLMEIWGMPESVRLRDQTLDKLARAPWNLLLHQAGTNATSRVLRPLLNDVVQRESFFEMRQVTNQITESFYAIRLNDERAAAWKTNLAQVIESLTGIRVNPDTNNSGWTLKKHDPPNFIQLARAGEWTLIGAGQNGNALFDAAVARLQRDQSSPVVWSTNYWLEFELDPQRAAEVFRPGAKLMSDLPLIGVSVTSEGADVRIDGEYNFARTLKLELPAWNIPVQLIDQPLASFNAVRGIGPWLGSLPFWKDLNLGTPPDQACSWAAQGLQMMTYFAASSSDASNTVSRIADYVLSKGQPWFESHDLAKFVRAEAYNGIEWRGLPYMWPFLRSMEATNGNFIFGGFFSHSVVNPLSPDVLNAPLVATNLVYHDWEATGIRAEQWIYVSQFARLVSKRAQLPFDGAGLKWLQAIAPKLENTVTQVTVTGERQLSSVRKSTIGLTGFELQLLVDWLESPSFPVGLHTLLASPPPSPW